MSILLSLQGVSKTYPGPVETMVLHDVGLEVREGDSVAVTGPSGSGKSTLLNLIGTLDHPTAGEIYFNDRLLRNMDAGAAAEFRNREIGFVFQLHHLLPQLTVLENVLLPLVPRGRAAVEAAREHAVELLGRIGLAGRLGHRPANLSGGERQRVAVARALLPDPALILADEPTGSLDAENADALGELLSQLNAETGTTLIVVTHSPDLAAKMARRYILSHGKLEPA